MKYLFNEEIKKLIKLGDPLTFVLISCECENDLLMRSWEPYHSFFFFLTKTISLILSRNFFSLRALWVWLKDNIIIINEKIGTFTAWISRQCCHEFILWNKFIILCKLILIAHILHIFLMWNLCILNWIIRQLRMKAVKKKVVGAGDVRSRRSGTKLFTEGAGGLVNKRRSTCARVPCTQLYLLRLYWILPLPTYLPTYYPPPSTLPPLLFHPHPFSLFSTSLSSPLLSSPCSPSLPFS